jgi:restriction system protein
MAIPKYDELQLPALIILSDGKSRRARDLVNPLSKQFNLTEEELNREYESGNGVIFYDRVYWALSYLNMAGAVSKPKRGWYSINDKGLALIKNPDSLRTFINSKIKEHESVKRKKKQTVQSTDNLDDLTPEESLFASFEGIKVSVYQEIIDTILSKTTREFEKLVVKLMQHMGYGGEIAHSGVVTQYSNDKGIDGVIKEDVLGFGRIHIQAKRYNPGNNVSREDIQKFVGAHAVAHSDKGVFITTSDFTPGAYGYVNSPTSGSKIVLINGTQLAEHIYNYNLGMQVEKVLEIKKLDSDFWDVMQDV